MTPEQLRNVHTLITHASCGDGLGAAMIVKAVLPDIKIVFAQYGTQAYKDLKPEDGCMFIDFTPSPEDADAWAATDTIVLDHHIHAKPVVDKFGDNGLFDNERSGALLAFDEVFAVIDDHPDALSEPGWERYRRYRDYAHLCSIRDLWQTENPLWDNAQALHAYMMAVDRNHWLDSGLPDLHEACIYGGFLAQARRNRARGIVNSKAMITQLISGHKVGITTGDGALSSDVGEQGRDAGFNVTCCFFTVIDKTSGDMKVVFSMRSDGSVDVGALAKANGGGGHAKAAGMSFDYRDAGAHPAGFWFDLLSEHLEGLTLPGAQ